MGTISLTLPADGQTIDAADVNTPFNAIATAINGGIDSTNITDGGVTPNELMSGTGSTWAWQSWTPTWTNVTIGNATVVAKYVQTGKTVDFLLSVVWGSTTSASGQFTYSLPVTTSANYAIRHAIGLCLLFDTSAGLTNQSVTRWVGTTTGDIVYIAGTLAQTNTSSTAPWTWATGDTIQISGTYEAA